MKPLFYPMVNVCETKELNFGAFVLQSINYYCFCPVLG